MIEPPQSTPTFREEQLDRGQRPLRNAFLPIMLLAVSVTTWFGFQTLQLVRERQQLEAAQVALAPQELAAAKLRTSLDQVATATAKLAAEGNANARLIVEQLRSRGVTINSSGMPPAR